MSSFSLEVLHPRNYDENLSENPFYQMFRDSRKEIYESAIRKGWLICIPRIDSLTKSVYQDADFLSHVLVEYVTSRGEKSWKTLQNQEVSLKNRRILTGKGFRHSKQVEILFQETCYSDISESSFQLLCLSEPLNTAPVNATEPSGLTLDVVQDCKEFLWEITGNKRLKEKVDSLIEDVKNKVKKLRPDTDVSIYQQKLFQLHEDSFEIVSQDSNVVRVLKQDVGFEKLIKLALETYILDSVYVCLFYCLTNCFSQRDTALNQIVRRWHELPASKAGIKIDFCDSLPRARKELNALPRCSTPLAKGVCLKRVFRFLSTIRSGTQNGIKTTQSSASFNDLSLASPHSEREADPITSDDLLSAVVFMIIKSDIPNWFTHINYASLFRLVRAPTDDEYSFYLTTMEASLEHILTLADKNPFCDSLALEESTSSSRYSEIESSNVSQGSSESDPVDTGHVKQLARLFQFIRLDECQTVIEILRRSHRMIYEGKQDFKHKEEFNASMSGRCHPLCQCQICHSKAVRRTVVGSEVALANSIPAQSIFASFTRSRSLLNVPPNTVTVHSANEQGLTVLHMAAQYGRDELVHNLLDQFNACIEQPDVEGRTPLHLACAGGHHDVALILMNAGANVNAADCEGLRPLHYATERAYDLCVKALLFYGGAKSTLLVDATDMRGNTALHLASRWGYESIVQLLLDSRADPLIQNHSHQTPLQIACYEVLSQIIAKACGSYRNSYPVRTSTSVANLSMPRTNSLNNIGSDMNSRRSSLAMRDVTLKNEFLATDSFLTTRQFTNDTHSTINNPHLHSRSSLMPFNAQKTVQQPMIPAELESPLYESTSSSATFRRQTKLDAAKQKAAELSDKVKKLLEAVAEGNMKEVQQVLKLSPLPMSCDLFELVSHPRVDILRTPCDPLCQCEKCSVVEKITYSMGTNQNVPHVNCIDKSGFSPLHVASIYNQTMIPALLLYEGADPRLRTFQTNQTPLHYAAEYNSVFVLKLLLLWTRKLLETETEDSKDDGAHEIPLWRQGDARGNTPLHCAAMKGHLSCIKEILSAARNWRGEEEVLQVLHSRNHRGNTPLHEASRPGHPECLTLLLSEGADPRMKNNQHLTASHLTLSLKCAALLKKAEEDRAFRQPRCISENPEFPLIDEPEQAVENSTSCTSLTRESCVPRPASHASSSVYSDEIGMEATELDLESISITKSDLVKYSLTLSSETGHVGQQTKHNKSTWYQSLALPHRDLCLDHSS